MPWTRAGDGGDGAWWIYTRRVGTEALQRRGVTGMILARSGLTRARRRSRRCGLKDLAKDVTGHGAAAKGELSEGDLREEVDLVEVVVAAGGCSGGAAGREEMEQAEMGWRGLEEHGVRPETERQSTRLGSHGSRQRRWLGWLVAAGEPGRRKRRGCWRWWPALEVADREVGSDLAVKQGCSGVLVEAEVVVRRKRLRARAVTGRS